MTLLETKQYGIITYPKFAFRWEPSARITPEEALQHEWLTSGGAIPISNNSSPSGEQSTQIF